MLHARGQILQILKISSICFNNTLYLEIYILGVVNVLPKSAIICLSNTGFLPPVVKYPPTIIPLSPPFIAKACKLLKLTSRPPAVRINAFGRINLKTAKVRKISNGDNDLF